MPAIAALGAAAEQAAGLAGVAAVTALRDRLESRLGEFDERVTILGNGAGRLGNTSCFAISGKASETLVMALDLAGYAISAGSACSSGKVRPSHVVSAMGYGEDVARGALRVSLGGWNTAQEIDGFVAQLAKAAGFQRNLPDMQPAA